MRRSILSVALAAVLVAAAASPVVAASAYITPTTQSHAHGVASHWSLSWGGYSPYTVVWDRGDGSGLYWASTTSTSYPDSHVFYPCTTTRFHQYLNVWDSHNNPAQDDSYATENGGNPC